MRASRISVVGLVLLMCSLAGCSGGASKVSYLEGQVAFATSTVTDWVTYADAFAEVTVEGESQLVGPGTDERGEGQVARKITLRVDDASWQGPARRESNLPDRFTVAHGGWIIREGSEPQRWLTEGEVWPEVGDKFAALVTWANLSLVVDPETRQVNADRRSPNAEWTLLALLPIEGERVSPAADQIEGPVKKAVTGLRVSEVGTLLQAVPIDPAAKKYMDLDPFVRSQMVSLDKG